MMKRFFKGIPITDTPPYSHRRKLPTMPELTPDQEVILLTPEKDTFNFGVGSGRNLAREQKEMLEQMEINVTPADNVRPTEIVLYPVDDRSANTLVPLIQKHVKPGSRIFSDSWAAYNTLNDIGYEHFSVVHKTSFKQKYVSTQTGEEVYCCTNRIEGAWKIAKDHFRAMNGTNTKMFEQHLCEIIWRNHHYRSDLYQSFFDLVNSVYTLDGPPRFNYQKPVFKTWTPPTKEDKKAHNITIVPDTEDELVEPSVEVTPVENDSQPGPSLLQAGEATPINLTRRKRRLGQQDYGLTTLEKLFWKKNLKHWERILLAAFAYVNGLNPEMFLDWVKLMGLCRDNSGIRHFTAFFRLVDSGRMYKLYAYNVTNNRYEYLDGTIRHYIHRNNRR
ncbi:unnamed protein product [Mytilus edulis]|uniref:ISXO2-like transposase domain-containing protein n=1 Tax=Mytilus edulis TaxID=6550 RepID=A0A8S3UY89_MYTED|nr:unnamed protein product [Mytilus edulis]